MWEKGEFLLVEGFSGRRFVCAIGSRQGKKSGEDADMEEVCA